MGGPSTYTFIQQSFVPVVPSHSRPAQTSAHRDFVSEDFVAGQRLGKPSGACVRCKKLKMKCDMKSGETKCQRCKGGDYDCVPARRRPRRPRAPAPQVPPLPLSAAPPADDSGTASSDEDPLAKTSPINMIKSMGGSPGPSLRARHHPALLVPADDADDELDDAQPPELQPASGAPAIVALLGADEARTLFALFLERMNPSAALLDPLLHTFDSVAARSGFLLTTVCAVAARFRLPAAAAARALEAARAGAADALVRGAAPGVEAVQACILLALYGRPAGRAEKDRSWLYSGLAIRMATDLDLHRLPPSAGSADRALLNRARAWIVCCNLDRSYATQFGRPPAISEQAAFLPRHGRGWGDAPASDPFDKGSVAFAELMALVARWQERVVRNGVLDPDVDLLAVTREYDAKFSDVVAYWQPRVEAHRQDLPACKYRALLFPFCAAYSRLVMYALGFQHAFAQNSLSKDNIFFVESYADAKRILQIVTHQLAPQTYYQHSFHSHYVYPTFAAAFLLKLLRPQLAPLLAPEQRAEILRLVADCATALAGAAVDAAHAPAQYARFLRALLARHGHVADAMDTAAPNAPPPPPQQQQPVYDPGYALPFDPTFARDAQYAPPPGPPTAYAAGPPPPLGAPGSVFFQDANSASPTAPMPCGGTPPAMFSLFTDPLTLFDAAGFPLADPGAGAGAGAGASMAAEWAVAPPWPSPLGSEGWWGQFAMPGWDAACAAVAVTPATAVPSAGASDSGGSAGGPWG